MPPRREAGGAPGDLVGAATVAENCGAAGQGRALLISEPSLPREPTREGGILVVDLEPNFGRLIRWILAEEGLAVEVVPSPPAALTRVAWGRPALVLLSLPVGYPRRSTVEFAIALRRIGRYGPSPPR